MYQHLAPAIQPKRVYLTLTNYLENYNMQRKCIHGDLVIIAPFISKYKDF